MVLTFALLVLPAAASAAAPGLLFTTPTEPMSGEGAGKLGHPRGIVQDPESGHFYVSDADNVRISEFDPWGEFVKAWGWDVAPGPVNEEQEVSVRAAAGEFRLSFDGDVTDDLTYSAPASEVEAALNGLPAVGGSGTVSVEGGPGGPNGGAPYVVRFEGGSLAATDVAELAVANGTIPLAGGIPVTETIVRTRAHGAAESTELEACTGASGCKKGLPGNGPGQFAEHLGSLGGGKGIALDSSGDLYVFEQGGSSRRVQKFSPDGRFLLMFGGEVNKTTLANVCTSEDLQSGEECGAGVSGGSDGQFSSSAFRDFISYDPATNSIFIGDFNRIQNFTITGNFIGKTEFDGVFQNKTVQALDVDPLSGDLYVSFMDTPDVYRLNPALTMLDDLGDLTDDPLLAPRNAVSEGPIGIAVDAKGRVYVVNSISQKGKVEILAFDAEGNPVPGMETDDRFGTPPIQGVDFFEIPTAPAIATGVLGPDSNEPGDLYIGYFGGGEELS